MGSPEALSVTRTVALCCVVAVLLAGTPLQSQSAKTDPAQQEPSVEPNVASKPDPDVSTLPLGEGPAVVPEEPSANREKVSAALLKENFSYNPNKMVDPFVSFISPAPSAPPELPVAEEEIEPPPQPQRPLTPLQKMNLGEIERGLKAIVWGEFGRRALIEDSAGKGYIVSIGTPAGEKNGVITDIFNDRIVIQQEIWDRKAKRLMPENFVVKLKKEQAK